MNIQDVKELLLKLMDLQGIVGQLKGENERLLNENKWLRSKLENNGAIGHLDDLH